MKSPRQYSLPPTPHATNTCVFRRDLHQFSQHVADRLLPEARERRQHLLAGPAGAPVPPLVLATCVFAPRYFYSTILDEWLIAEEIGVVDRGLREELEQLEPLLASGRLLPSQEPPGKNHVRLAFQRVAKRLYPHFFRLQESGGEVVRICLFHRDIPQYHPSMMSQEDRNYLDAFESAHHNCLTAVYTFFRWLNGANRCLVALPGTWSAIGLKEPRDFAVFNGELLVEFHRDEHLFLQVEPGLHKSPAQRWARWAFCDMELFSNYSRDGLDLVDPDHFFELVFLGIETLRRRADMSLTALKNYFNDHVNPQGGTRSIMVYALETLESLAKQVRACQKRSILSDVVVSLGGPQARPSGLADARQKLEAVRRLINELPLDGADSE